MFSISWSVAPVLPENLRWCSEKVCNREKVLTKRFLALVFYIERLGAYYGLS
jgi:hypothetical protein